MVDVRRNGCWNLGREFWGRGSGRLAKSTSRSGNGFHTVAGRSTRHISIHTMSARKPCVRQDRIYTILIAGERAPGIPVASLHGPQFHVRAKVFIVAVNGIETPRLLLLSNRIEKAGLGNRHDLVGRFFMEHPHLWSGLYIPSDRKLFRTAGLYDLHIEKGVPVIGQLTISEDVLQQEKMLNYSVVIEPSFRPSPHKQGARARGD